MKRIQILIVFAFLVAFGAGAVVGMVQQQATKPPHRDHGWLEKELNLTPDQRDKMHAIWSELTANSTGRQTGEHRRDLQKQRDDSIRALLSTDLRAKYDEIQKTYEDKVAQMSADRKKAFEDAVEKTKGILTEEQKVKYEAFLKTRSENNRGGMRSSTTRTS